MVLVPLHAAATPGRRDGARPGPSATDSARNLVGVGVQFGEELLPWSPAQSAA